LLLVCLTVRFIRFIVRPPQIMLLSILCDPRAALGIEQRLHTAKNSRRDFLRAHAFQR
jgi:hypothetical protein